MKPYFGPAFARKEWEVQVETPVGTPCGYCADPIEEGDTGTLETYVVLVDGEPVAETRPVHYECNMRQVIGSVAHVEGICSCNIPGSIEGDPPGSSLHEGALLAVMAWQRTKAKRP